MNKPTERVKGRLAKISETVKKSIDAPIDNSQLQLEGDAEKIKSQVHQELEKAEEQARNLGERLVGRATSAAGGLSTSARMQREGRAKGHKGKNHRSGNR